MLSSSVLLKILVDQCVRFTVFVMVVKSYRHKKVLRQIKSHCIDIRINIHKGILTLYIILSKKMFVMQHLNVCL